MEPNDEKLKEKLKEIIDQKREEDKKNADIIPLPICVSMGCALGLMLGTVLGNLPVGICIGLAAGCAFYGIMILFRRRKKSKEDE